MNTALRRVTANALRARSGVTTLAGARELSSSVSLGKDASFTYTPPGRNHLFVPGPTNIPDRIQRAMVRSPAPPSVKPSVGWAAALRCRVGGIRGAWGRTRVSFDRTPLARLARDTTRAAESQQTGSPPGGHRRARCAPSGLWWRVWELPHVHRGCAALWC